MVGDQNQISNKVLCTTLQSKGYNVVSCSDGGEAVKLLLGPAAPDIALLDWDLTIFNALDICRQLKGGKQANQVYIILMAEEASENTVIQSYEAGADAFLNKPVEMDKLVEKVSEGKHLVDRWKAISNLRQSQFYKSRLAAIARLGQGLAHEVNNPLGIIQINTRKMQKMINSGEKINEAKTKKYFDRVYSSIERIHHVIKSLRSFAQESTKKNMTKTVLRRLLDDSLIFISEKMNNDGVKLKVHDFPHDTEIVCHSPTVCSALLHLLFNAYDAVQEKSDALVEIKVEIKEGFVDFDIIDNGPGVAEEYVDFIKEPFFTTKEVGTAMGLGLSIADGIINQHDGTLKYKREGDRTHFIMSLPLNKLKNAKESALKKPTK